jgi:hypothetical protein
MNGTSEAGSTDVKSDQVGYAEDRCGFGMSGFLSGVIAPWMFLVFLVLGLITGQELFAVPAGLCFGWWALPGLWKSSGTMGLGAAYFRFHRIGIQIDGQGVRLGGVGRGAKELGKKQGKPFYQARHEFFCPWSGVRSLRIVTDRAEIKKYFRMSCYVKDQFRSGKVHPTVHTLGMLVPSYAKAVLVVEFDPNEAVVPEFRTVYGSGKLANTALQTPIPSEMWTVATRHPDRLRRALADAGWQV